MDEEVSRWLDQAEHDLKSSRNNLMNGDYYVASLLCQQAVEKGLKALYLKKFKKVKKIHNLVILAKDLGLPTNLVDKCDKLNPIYIDTRYPDASGDVPYKRYNKEKSEHDVKLSEDILKWIKKNI